MYSVANSGDVFQPLVRLSQRKYRWKFRSSGVVGPMTAGLYPDHFSQYVSGSHRRADHVTHPVQAVVAQY